MISGVDRALGRVLGALRERGLADDTVLVFTSDNGYFLGERGLAGLLYALVAADVLVLKESDAERSPPERGTVTRLVEAAAALAEDADYFAILGLPPTAAGPAIHRAHAARHAELSALPLDLLGLEALEGPRAAALEAIKAVGA